MSSKKRVYPQSDQIPVGNIPTSQTPPVQPTPTPSQFGFGLTQQTQQTQPTPIQTQPPVQSQPSFQSNLPSLQSTPLHQGSTNVPPTSSQPPSQFDPDHLKKHKHLVGYELDPEGLAPMNNLTNAMGQMNVQPQTLAPGSSVQYTHPITETVANPLSQCPPLFMRMTTSVVANTTSLLNKSGIPLGCVIHPMAQPVRPEDRIPVVNFGGSGIIRCRKCRAYINPFVSWVDSGRKWRCNLCSFVNEVPSDYYSPLDSNGIRQDINERPELSRGCVEFIAPSEYMVRPPQPPCYFFVLDVSYPAVHSGMFHTAVHTIKQLLNNFPGDVRTRIGFITYDTSIHFYNLKSNLSQAQMLVVSDIDDVFLPIPDNLLVNLYDSKKVINGLLEKLPTMFQSTQITQIAPGVALKAVSMIVKNIGGKVILFSSGLPSIGAGKLPNRESQNLLGTDKEVQLLVPDDQFYKEFALECSKIQVSIDLFLFAHQFTDVATLAPVAQFSGGQIYFYPGFRADRDGERFYYDLARLITRETGWEAIMRVRTSKGINVAQHFGNFFIRSTDLLALPSVDADKAFAVQLELSESTLTSKAVSLQSALLYTTSSGSRRIRVFTQCLNVTSNLADIFRLADAEALATLTAKMAIEKALTSKLSDSREALVNKCIEILTVYRKELVVGNYSGQLMLPDSLKSYPQYVLALIKNIVLRAGNDIRPDERAYSMSLLRTLPVNLAISFLYPRLFALHNMIPEVGSLDNTTKTVILPPTLGLSSEKLDRKGVYLLEDGQSMYVWVGKLADPELLTQLFGVPSLETVDTLQLRLPKLETTLSAQVNAVIQQIRSQRPTYQHLHIFREGEPREAKFFSYFVDDRSRSVHSYNEFLANLYQRVQAKLQNN